MKKRIFAALTAMLIVFGAGTAYADTTLYTPMLSSPTGGRLDCHATNVGKKSLSLLGVRLLAGSSMTYQGCPDVPPQWDARGEATCSVTTTTSAVCEVTVKGGSHRSVRAVLNVVDSSGATILSVPASK